MTEAVLIRISPDLVSVLDKCADGKNMTRNEFYAMVLAGYVERPDLAEIPRKRLGRKRDDEKKRTRRKEAAPA